MKSDDETPWRCQLLWPWFGPPWYAEIEDPGRRLPPAPGDRRISFPSFRRGDNARFRPLVTASVRRLGAVRPRRGFAAVTHRLAARPR